MADLRRFAAPAERGPRRVVLQRGATVADLLVHFGIPANEHVTTSVNGALAERGHALADGDEVLFFSQMQGG